MSDQESDRLFRRGRYEEAAGRLEKGLKSHGEDGKDSLLYLMDIGLSYHSAGKYEESNQAFLKADKMAEIKDYTSLAAEGATLLTSENIKHYPGEDFEKILINTYLAVNYALLGDHENALVEARRVNHKLHLMVTEGKRKYKQNAFARYLSAVLYEADGSYDDALIDYKEAAKLVPDFPGLGRDLWRCAKAAHMPDEMEDWAEKFSLTARDREIAKQVGPWSKKGEIIVLYENGISPVKRPNPILYSIPSFFPRYNPVMGAHIEINEEYKGDTSVLENIEDTAIKNLDEKYGGIIAKKVAGVVAKELVAKGVEDQTKSPILGFLARILMYASDQADLRSWNLLPRDLQILRIPVEEGTYRVRATPIGRLTLPEKVVQVGARKKVFVNFRFMPE